MSLHHLNEHIGMIDAPLSGKTKVLGTYLVKGDETAIIDPGPTNQALGVMDVLRRNQVGGVSRVLLTHIHLDHSGGSWKMVDEYPRSHVYCHPRGAAHMVDPAKLRAGAESLFAERVLEYGTVAGVPEYKVVESRDGDVLDLGGIKLEVLWTPGHSSHSQSYWEPDSKTVFVGDAAGHSMGEDGPVIPVSPPPHNPVKAVESIDRIIGLNPELLCIAHFGPQVKAVEHLKSVKERTILWEKLALQAVDEGLDLDDLTMMVIEEEDGLAEHVNEASSPERSIRGSLLGFHMYGKWKQGQA